MSRALRILLVLLMVAGMFAFVTAPTAKTATPQPIMVADGGAPMPTCLPSQPWCKPPIQPPAR